MANEKVALITGANKGLGFETALQLAAQGYTVVLGSRNLDAGRQAAEKIGANATAIKLDVTSQDDRKAAVKAIEEKFGRLDVLVNNAGIAEDAAAGEWKSVEVENTSEDLLRGIFETNFFGTVAVTKAMLPLLKKSGDGRIVNLSSILGSLTQHQEDALGMRHFAYDASKTALNAFTVHLAADLKETDVKVYSAHPGWVKTDMGGSKAPIPVEKGVQTVMDLITKEPPAPSGSFVHRNKPLPW